MLSSGRHLAFLFRIGTDGRTAAPLSDAEHVRDELLQLLLTSPGERLFLPEFGGGVRKLVFEPASDASSICSSGATAPPGLIRFGCSTVFASSVKRGRSSRPLCPASSAR